MLLCLDQGCLKLGYTEESPPPTVFPFIQGHGKNRGKWILIYSNFVSAGMLCSHFSRALFSIHAFAEKEKLLFYPLFLLLPFTCDLNQGH